MKHLKQTILLLFYFTHRFGRIENLRREEKYLSYNFLYLLLWQYRQSSVRKAVIELRCTSLLDSIVRDRQVLLRLTVLGEKQVKQLLHNYFHQKKSQAGWLAAIIGEKADNRNLIGKLVRYGFVPVRAGVYMAPLPIGAVKQMANDYPQVIFLYSGKLEYNDERQLANRLYRIDAKQKQMGEFISQADQLLSSKSKKKSLTQHDIKTVSAISNKFFRLIINTVGVPKNYLPGDWLLEQAATKIHQLLLLCADGNRAVIFNK